MAKKLTLAANKIFQWLLSFGLSVDKDKCRVMFFHPQHHNVGHYGELPKTLQVTLGNNQHMSITPKTHLRYLGIFFTPKLNWSTHIQIMATHVCSTVKALGVLGNSI
jgi:hypothetical protein